MIRPEEVTAALGPGPAVVEHVGHQVVASATVGIWRVRTELRSAVVKVLAHSAAGHENWRSGAAEDHWYYWRREACAYESGVLGSLAGGLRAPECYLVAEREDGSVALWLEDLRGEPASHWALDRYGLAARHFGRAQGEFVAGRALPAEPWWSRGWLRAYLSQRDGNLALLEDPAAWRHPLVATWFPDAPAAELGAMRRNQDRYLTLLAEMPATLSHLDLHPDNLFAASDATALIDWAFVGRGALGEDAGNLVPDAVLDFHVDPAVVEQLYDTVVEGYARGLQDAGAGGETDRVRLAMSAAMCAKYAWIAPAILRAARDNSPQLNRRALGKAITFWAPVVRFLLRRSREVAELIGDPR